jgi:hypothetical protein
MLQTIPLRSATQKQVELVEHALRQLTKISRSTWPEIPQYLHPAFARYMSRDAWTGEPDVLTLSEAALLIVRDAIMRIGEFSDDEAWRS